MRKRSVVIIALFLFAGQLFAQDAPNIVLIMADDLGYGDLSCYGNTTILTPNLDKMAREGMKFTDFHSNGAVCSPTRAALLTGKYQQRVGIEGVVTAKSHRNVGLALNEVTFADAMKQEGYATGMMGKWHLGYPEKFNPIHQGFDEYTGFVSGNVDYFSHVDQEAYEDWWVQNELVKEEGYSTDLITKHAVEFIKNHQDEKFLLYIAHEAPHSPYQGRESEAFRVVGERKGQGPGVNIEAMYKEMVEVMDEGIGKVMDVLKELNLAENTVVIFCSDNGPNKNGNNGGLHGNKASVWEGGHRVPAIAWWPGTIRPGQLNHQTVMTMDLFPTMLSMAGGEKRIDLDGVDISKVLLKNKRLPKRDLFWRHFNNAGTKQLAAVRSGNWKLIRLGETHTPQLYNLKEDLAENQDLANEYSRLARKMVRKLKNWEQKTTKSVKRISP